MKQTPAYCSAPNQHGGAVYMESVIRPKEVKTKRKSLSYRCRQLVQSCTQKVGQFFWQTEENKALKTVIFISAVVTSLLFLESALFGLSTGTTIVFTGAMVSFWTIYLAEKKTGITSLLFGLFLAVNYVVILLDWVFLGGHYGVALSVSIILTGILPIIAPRGTLLKAAAGSCLLFAALFASTLLFLGAPLSSTGSTSVSIDRIAESAILAAGLFLIIYNSCRSPRQNAENTTRQLSPENRNVHSADSSILSAANQNESTGPSSPGPIFELSGHKRYEVEDAGTIHDLKNMIGVFVTYPQLLLTDLPEKHDLRKPLELILDAGRKANTMVQTLLEKTRDDEPDFEVIELNNLVTSFFQEPTVAFLRQRHPNVRIEQKLSAAGKIAGNQLQLQNALMNLIVNGAESISGPGSVRVETSTRLVSEVDYCNNSIPPGCYQQLTVTDTGNGIPKDHLKRIFQPYFTTKGADKNGNGLGMAVVQSTVKIHGGYIQVNSKVGAGTSFTIYFPAIPGTDKTRNPDYADAHS